MPVKDENLEEGGGDLMAWSISIIKALTKVREETFKAYCHDDDDHDDEGIKKVARIGFQLLIWLRNS